MFLCASWGLNVPKPHFENFYGFYRKAAATPGSSEARFLGISLLNILPCARPSGTLGSFHGWLIGFLVGVPNMAFNLKP